MLTQLDIASVLLLEFATTLYLTTNATLDEALDHAFSKLDSFCGAVVEAFPLPYSSYTKGDYLGFLLKNRLCKSLISFFSLSFIHVLPAVPM